MGADFFRADLTGADLTGADLRLANFTEANLTRANLAGANLEKAKFDHANLTKADLSWTNLIAARLFAADLTKTNLAGVDWTYTFCSGVYLSCTFEELATAGAFLCDAGDSPRLLSPQRRHAVVLRAFNFDWSQCAGATNYQLIVLDGKGSPVVDENSIASSYVGEGLRTIGVGSGFFSWKAKACLDGQWSDWSDTREFSVGAEIGGRIQTPSLIPAPASEPEFTLLSPTEGQVATGRANGFFSSDVSALTGVDQVEYFVDGVLRSVANVGPNFRSDFNATNVFNVFDGCHIVQARALLAGVAELGISNTVSMTVPRRVPPLPTATPAEAPPSQGEGSLESLEPGTIVTVAGGGTAVSDGLATSANISNVFGMAVDASGNLFISDGLKRIRRIDTTTGTITTVAGPGKDVVISGDIGDDGPATSASIGNVFGLVVDASGNLFISGDKMRVRRVDASTNIITTMAGTGTVGFSGDKGFATIAKLNFPAGVAVDTSGNLFIADRANHRIRMVDASVGIITTVAGTGTPGFSGDGGPATSATLNAPISVAVGPLGSLFISESDRIRKVDAFTGIITTVAGTGTGGFSGDGGPAISAQLQFPNGLAFDKFGNLFIADASNHRIRRVDAATGVITTVAGSRRIGVGAGSFSGDGGPATSATFNTPRSVVVDAKGNLLIADQLNQRIRRIQAGSLLHNPG